MVIRDALNYYLKCVHRIVHFNLRVLRPNRGPDSWVEFSRQRVGSGQAVRGCYLGGEAATFCGGG